MVPPLFSGAHHVGRVSVSGTGPDNWASSAPAAEDPSVEQELTGLQREETALEQCWRTEAAAQSAAFERELAAFKKRQELSAEKEKAVEQQARLVADQAAALEIQRQAIMLQQQQIQEAQRSLELNRQAAAVAQEQRERAQAAANIRAAAELARQVAEENAALEAALLDQQRRADELAAADHLNRQPPIAAAIGAEVARFGEEHQVLEAVDVAARLADQRDQLLIEAAVVLEQGEAVHLPVAVDDQPAAARGQPAEQLIANEEQPVTPAGLPQVRFVHASK